ncbi:MAG: hypothetical protein ABSB70_15470 [Candidatus Velthaea sp.]|jgi:hypothetical protein
MLNKRAWLLPVNTSILFAILCFWAIQNHDTLFAVISVSVCMLNAYLAYRWFKMRRPTKS